MATHRLPTLGSDNGTWGAILNDYLAQSHNPDGTLADNVVGVGQLQDASITATKLAGNIAGTKLDSAAQTSLAMANNATPKPSSGVNGKVVKWNNATGQLEDATAQLDGAYAPLTEVWMPAPSGADDTAALQAVINGLSGNTVVRFRLGTYLISSPLVFRGGCSYVGSGHANAGGTVIKQKTGSNIGVGLTGGAFQGLFAAHIWATAPATPTWSPGNHNVGPFCDSPVLVDNICFDGNSSGNVSSVLAGIVLLNYWSQIRNCYIINMTSHGIVVTDSCFSGAIVQNSANTETRILNSKIDTVVGDGINQSCANLISCQDGYCVDNLISNISGSGVNYQRASGWVFRRNHLYGIKVNGIRMDNCFSNVVTENYIEDFGGANVTGVYYIGISLNQLDGRGSIVTQNFVGCSEPSINAVGSYNYISISSAFAATDANVVCANNQIEGPSSPTNKGQALVFQNDTNGILSLRAGNNRISKVNTPTYLQPGVRVFESDSQQREHDVTTSTISSYSGAGGGNNIVITGSDLSGTIVCGTGSSVAAGVLFGVIYEQVFATPPVVVITPMNVATQALGIYVSSSADGFELNTSNAPVANQGGTTFKFAYIVKG